jgi:hypothetical protein
VDQESTTGFEPNNQILAAAVDGRDTLAFELRRHRGRLEWTHEAGVGDLDRLEASADQVRLECETDRLDLG